MNKVNLSAWGPEPPLFVRLLAIEVAKTDITETAKSIGMHRASVSTVLRNCYPSNSTAGIERRVMEKLGCGKDWIICPVQEEQTITHEKCQAYRDKPAPTHNPSAMQLWRMCQHCPTNPHCHKERTDARVH